MYLIDTHAYLWFLIDDPRLPVRVKDIMQRENDLFISIASFWEMAIKMNIGKLTLPASIPKLIADCKELQIDVLQISPQHLDCISRMPDFHGDPFDRLILSQAMVEHMTLLSADEKFGRYEVRTLWR
ncbi:MAG: type II toxin-antitoxin system VapC family toxin [Clostridiales bacterium]|nr:type II toxin-antitoxin system VapC family toxin [Clostridiales bacterium]